MAVSFLRGKVGMIGDGGEILVGEGDEVGSTRWALFSLRCRGLVGIACFWPNR